MCFGLCANVNSPAWCVPQRSNSAIVGSSSARATPPRPDEVGVAHERGGIGKTQERAECEPEDAVGLVEILLGELVDRELHRG
jgi:hypothetical protein